MCRKYTSPALTELSYIALKSSALRMQRPDDVPVPGPSNKALIGRLFLRADLL